MKKNKLKKHLSDHVYVSSRKRKVLKNTVLLEAAKGQGIDGHILSLLKSEKIKHWDKVYVAIVSDKVEQVKRLLDKNGISEVSIIEYNSLDYYKKLARCEYLINDTTFSPVFNKRKDQNYSIIWHGTPLKHLGKDVSLVGFGNVQNNFLSADTLFVSNEHTKNVMIEAFNLTDISKCNVVVAPSPRNSLLFQEGENVYNTYIETEKNYLYLPTWRDGGKETYLSFLSDIDEQLNDNESFFVKLHPLAKKNSGLDFSTFKHVKEFPEADLYQFIPLMDVVVTDYSSIFFDVFKLNKKLILFNYDKEHYFSSRGVYEEVEELGLTECQTINELMVFLRGNTTVDYSELALQFAKYDNAKGNDQVLDYIISGENSFDFSVQNIRNTNQNIVIFAGALWDNGISKSFFNFINEFEFKNSNIILMIERGRVSKKHMHKLEGLPSNITYIERHGGPIANMFEKLMSKYYTSSKESRLFDNVALKAVKKIYSREFERIFQGIEPEKFIHFTGFDASIALLTLGGKEYEDEIIETMFCHTDMLEEYKKKSNFNKKIILETYKTVDNIAVVNKNIGSSLAKEYPELSDKVITTTNFIGSGAVRDLSNASIYTDIRIKKQTLGLPISESINQFLESHDITGPYFSDALGTMEHEFPWLVKCLPEIKKEHQTLLNINNSAYYDFKMLPHIYGYTKMRLLDDLENPAIKTFVYLGRYSPEKGIERILYAFEQIYSQNTSIRLIMISPHGVTKKRVLDYLRNAVIRDVVYIFDGMDNPYNLVSKCDALILSSYYEGLGLVALEAIASDTKVITTDLQELTRIIKNYGSESAKIINRDELSFDESDYRRFLEDTNLGNPLFYDTIEESYPVKYDAEAMIVENSARGIYYGMSHFLYSNDSHYSEFDFEALREESQNEYSKIVN